MRKLLISILSVMILGVVTVNAADFLSKPKAVKLVREGINLIKARLMENGITLPHWNKMEDFKTMFGEKGSAEYIAARYGNLQYLLMNLQIPSGTISNKVDWANLFYNCDKYLLTSKDVYEYYYRLYQFVSFGPPPSLAILNVNISFMKKFYKGINLAAPILVDVYEQTNDKKLFRKAVFNYILFTGTMLNKLSDDHFAKKYFSKYERDWAKLRAILNKIKEEDSKKWER